MKYPKYLVRPHDYHIFEIDESNGCYRSYSTRNVTYSDGTRPQAQSHFTFDNLVKNYGFFPIQESDLSRFEKEHEFEMGFRIWQSRNDGHGGAKGGTYGEYLQHLEELKERENEQNSN